MPDYVSAGVTERLKHVTYQPLPYDTHPVDTVPDQWQGFGPFAGPYTPWNFQSAKDSQAPGGIDIYWTQGNNVVDYAPAYNVITLMRDRSLDLVNNPGLAAVLSQNAAASVSNNTSTITNVNNVQTSGVNRASIAQHGFFTTLAQWIKGL